MCSGTKGQSLKTLSQQGDGRNQTTNCDEWLLKTTALQWISGIAVRPA
jgi:hypothetical protein